MPNCREAIYVGNRVFGLYGPDFIAISDILLLPVLLPIYLPSDWWKSLATMDVFQPLR